MKCQLCWVIDGRFHIQNSCSLHSPLNSRNRILGKSWDFHHATVSFLLRKRIIEIPAVRSFPVNVVCRNLYFEVCFISFAESTTLKHYIYFHNLREEHLIRPIVLYYVILVNKMGLGKKLVGTGSKAFFSCFDVRTKKTFSLCLCQFSASKTYYSLEGFVCTDSVNMRTFVPIAPQLLAIYKKKQMFLFNDPPNKASKPLNNLR